MRAGNKWVMTKWIYSSAQMWAWPCDAARGPSNYHTFTNRREGARPGRRSSA